MGMKEGILGGGTRKTKAWEVRILAIQQAHLADVWEGRSKLWGEWKWEGEMKNNQTT